MVLIKSLALKGLSGQSVANSVRSSLWGFEQFVDRAFSTPNSSPLVTISTLLGGMQYAHLLHAQDLGFLGAGFKCRLTTELPYNAGHVIFFFYFWELAILRNIIC